MTNTFRTLDRPTALRLAARGFAVALLAGGLAGSPVGAETWRFDVSPGELLEVDLEPGGDVEIVGGAGSEVVVEADVRGRDADELEISAKRTARGVEVRAEMARGRRSTSVDAELRITVPEHFDLDLSSTGGGFRIVGVDGRIEGQTQGGGIELERVRGEVELGTMGGAIDAVDVDADGSVETMGGTLHFTDVRGGLDGSTMGGAITLEGGGRVKLTTMGGKVVVKSAPEGATVSTMGGEVHVDSAHAPFEASTMGGDLEAHIDGGDGDIELESMGGDLEVWLPADLDATFEIELRQTRGADGAYVIESEFPVTTEKDAPRSRRREGRSWGDGGRETVWSADGKVGSGKPRVRLFTVDGDIRIHRGN